MTQKDGAELLPGGNSIPGIETYIIDPPGLGTALRISVAAPVKPALPSACHSRDVIIYATDADFNFGTVVDTARIAIIGGAMAPATIVGIGYAEETGSLDFATARRFWDFYRGPSRSMDAGAYGRFRFGGADVFLAALRDHVIPAVERKIASATLPRRILLGTSAGGHFAAHAMMQEPKLFQGVALMSPVLVDVAPEGDGVHRASASFGALVQEMERLSCDALPFGLRVFLSAGELEEDPQNMFHDLAIISNALRMRSALARLGAETSLQQFAGEDHGSVPGAAISRALRFLAPPDGNMG